jgi:hypothetical protein
MTTPTDFRELCAELHAAVQLYTGQNPSAANTPPNEIVSRLMDAMSATATALSQPEPEGPTDKELGDLLYYQYTASTGHGERQDVLGFARGVLARWGR